MKEYDVKITETLEKTVTVQAESHDAAEEQVRAAYYNSEYILDSENFTGVAFGTTEEREVQKEQADTMNVLLVKPFMYPQAVQIGCELEDLQKAVGGDIEATYPFNEPVALVMHDEGTKLPSMQSLYEEFHQLAVQKKQDYAEYRQVRKEKEELLIAKRTVETILNIGRQKEQEKEQEKEEKKNFR